MEQYQKNPCPDACELCGSTTDYLNFHHLIPRTLHSVKWFEKNYDKGYMKHHGIWICKSHCHKQIHEFIDEKEMGKTYNTLEALMTHPEVKKYVEWRSKRVN
jgi:5-methylcytosine-specific restriction endonuclease McrA